MAATTRPVDVPATPALPRPRPGLPSPWVTPSPDPIPGRPDLYSGRAAIDPPPTGHEALRALAEHEHQQRLTAAAMERLRHGAHDDVEGIQADHDDTDDAIQDGEAVAATDPEAAFLAHQKAASLAAAKARVAVARQRRVTPAALRPDLPPLVPPVAAGGRPRLFDARRVDILNEALEILADRGRMNLPDLARVLYQPLRHLSGILAEAAAQGLVTQSLAPCAPDTPMLLIEHYELPAPRDQAA